jgi:hypothetical protein
MIRIFYPTKDASLYQEYDWRNTGHDEILEVGKSTTNSIRSLIQFDINSISASIADGTIANSASFDLKLFVARADDLPLDQQIYLYQVSRSWSEGSGYFYQNTNVPFTSSRSPSSGFFENDGATWLNRQSGSVWSATGSEFYVSSVVSGTIADPVIDMVFDVTTMVRNWISGTISNNGFVLKFPDADELNHSNNGNIKFFSKQTHTVYVPQLITKWTDQQYITGSLTGSNETQAIVSFKNLKPKYKLGEFVRVDLSVKDRYPLKTFNSLFSAHAGDQRLPSSSFFQIVDNQSNQIVIPFDNYSKVHCDGSGSFVKFKVEGMYPGRFYKVQIKVVNSEFVQIHDSGHLFTIESI